MPFRSGSIASTDRSLIRRLSFFVAAALVSLVTAVRADDPPIGPTLIPFYTGNLSVSPFMIYWGTAQGPVNDLVTPERISLLKRISCFADCDYQSWALTESEHGKWDFSMYRKNAEALHAAGIGYIPFCWVHFAPKWYLDDPEFVPYQCVEHGEKLIQLSPWGPAFWSRCRAFYAAQHAAIGDQVDWMRVATPSDYGEIGYPAGMTSWLVPQKHAHAGYWCGDPFAREDFRTEMRKRFGTLSALNARWGSSFRAWADVTYPDVLDEKAAAVARKSGKATDRRRWLDFIEWYSGYWSRFVPRLCSLIRDYYPKQPLIVSVGYASELTKFGNDYSAVPKLAHRVGIALQTPGNVPYYALKRVSTACRFYNASYYTEPPGDVTANSEIARVFNDVSNGVQVFFDYPQNLDRVRGPLASYKQHMTGARPVVDVAIFHPTTEHRLACGADNFPKNAYMLAEIGRDLFDYDVIDEELISDGALARYRVLAYVAGNVAEASTLRKIAEWVRRGGVLVTAAMGSVETVEGDKHLWDTLLPDDLGGAGRNKPTGDGFRVSRVGNGLVIRADAQPDNSASMARIVARVAYHLSDIAPGFSNAPLVDAEPDSVVATLFPDRILYYNGTDKKITKHISLREEDWAKRAKRPERLSYDLTLAPHSMLAIMLLSQREFRPQVNNAPPSK